MPSMLGPIITLLSLATTTIVSSQNIIFDSAQSINLVSRATNTSNVIVLGGGATGTTGSSGWTGSTVTLDQCNARCASVNLVLFTTCGAYANVFRDQMRCSCSTTFISEVQVCSSCCNQLSYQSQFQELTQVSTACQVLAVNGNTTNGAMSISYNTQTQYETVTNFATVSYDHTTTVVVASPTTYTPPPATTTSTITTTTPFTTTPAPAPSTTTVQKTNPLPTVPLPTVTAMSAAVDFSTSMQSMLGPLLFTSFLLMATALI